MDEQLLSFFYKWHRFEKTNNIDIIDIDLLQQGKNFTGAFSNRAEVTEELQRIIDKYRLLPDRHPAVQAKLEASLYFLKALMGQDIMFQEYISKTMGVEPKYIEDDILQRQLGVVEQAYKKIGYSWSKEGIAGFEADHLLSQREIEMEYKTFQDKALPEIKQWLGINVDIDYKVTFVDKNEYWMNWISGDEDGQIHVRCNLNKRHKWLKGVAEYSVQHEICAHAVQISLWKKRLQQGKIPPFLGLLSVFSPEQFTLEGIAESLYYFYPENLFSDYGIASLQSDNLRWIVWNNAHIMANTGIKKEAIVDCIQTYLPDLSEEVIEKNLQEKTQDPLGRTYQYIYGISLYYHMILANNLSEKQKKKYILDSFNNIFSPEEILQGYSAIQSRWYEHFKHATI